MHFHFSCENGRQGTKIEISAFQRVVSYTQRCTNLAASTMGRSRRQDDWRYVTDTHCDEGETNDVAISKSKICGDIGAFRMIMTIIIMTAEHDLSQRKLYLNGE